VPFLHSLRDTLLRVKARTEIGRRSWAKPECNNDIRNRDFKEWLRLGSEMTSGRIFGKAIGFQIVKRIFRTSVRIRKMSVSTLWRSRPLPKRKKIRLTAD
jgi:hypothetical protein